MAAHGSFLAAFLFALTAFWLDTSAAEQPTLDYKRLQEALRSTDASTRYEAFGQAVESGRPEFREMAITIGFSSSDPGMQQLAVRAAFIGTTVIAPELADSDASSELKSNFARHRPDIAVATYDWRTGSINMPGAEQGSGQVTGNSITYSIGNGTNGSSNYSCSVSMRRAGESWEFDGTAKCNWYYYQSYNVSVSYLMR